MKTVTPCRECVAIHGESADLQPRHLELVAVVTRRSAPFEEHYECPNCGASLARAVAAALEARTWFLVDGVRH